MMNATRAAKRPGGARDRRPGQRGAGGKTTMNCYNCYYCYNCYTCYNCYNCYNNRGLITLLKNTNDIVFVIFLIINTR